MTGPLAGRWARFKAALIDTLLILSTGVLAAIFIPRMVQIGTPRYGTGFSNPWAVAALILWVLIVLVLLIIQAVKLHRYGQTIGKQVAGIRIVKISDESNGGIVTNGLMRVVVPHVIGAVPLLGLLFTLADYCFIFRADRRCLHDLIAGTRVVEAEPMKPTEPVVA